MDTTRREFLIASACAIAATACSNPTAPSTTTPLLAALQRDGYTVVEQKNPDGGVALLINGKLQKIMVGLILIGIDPSKGIDPAKSGPPNLNIGQYEVPDNLGYILVA